MLVQSYRNSHLLLKSVAYAMGLLFVIGITKPVAAADKITYLALGDSVVYGLNVDILPPINPGPLPKPSDFIGYPEVIGSEVGHSVTITVTNPACPGATSGSFLTAGAPDYGCYSHGPQGQPPFISSPFMKVTYSSSQLAYALQQLAPPSKVNFVTLQIGSNDALLLLEQCNNNMTCVEGKLPEVLLTYSQNLTKILTQIRSVYHGTLVLVGYYSPESALDSIAIAVDATMLVTGLRFGINYADGFTAFKLAAAAYGGDPCKAGLLVTLPPAFGGGCDIHPSLLGQQVLANTVMFSVGGLH
jgi:lysophospholipase L1-like esterase